MTSRQRIGAEQTGDVGRNEDRTGEGIEALQLRLHHKTCSPCSCMNSGPACSLHVSI